MSATFMCISSPSCRYFFHVLHSYIPTTEAFLNLLTQLRAVYDGILKQSGLHKRVYERVSKKATLASTLEEVYMLGTDVKSGPF